MLPCYSRGNTKISQGSANRSSLRRGPLGTFNILKTCPTERRGAARYDLVFVFDRPAGNGPIEKFSLVGQMLLAGDAPAP